MINKEFARDLVAQFGTPLYAYDLEEIERRAKVLLSILPARSTLFYSLKANPLPAIGMLLNELGCGAEISSQGELEAALDAGFSPSKILYTGPGKTQGEIHYALKAGVSHFSCESWGDLARLESSAHESSLKVKALLRVNPSAASGAQLAMAGVPSQFGFEEKSLTAGAEKLKSLDDHIEIFGFHVYYGTQIDPCDELISTMQNAIQVAERLSEQLDFTIRVVNIGGGFPWPYAMLGKGPDLSETKHVLSELSSQKKFMRSARLWFESGRYLSASSGTLLTSVVDVKESKGGKKYIVLDAGINNLGGMSGLGRILRTAVAIEPIELMDSSGTDIFDIVGPLCTPLDCIARNVEIPRLNPGDLVCIPNVGAYGLTASLIGFLSRPPPLEVAYRDMHCVDVFRLRAGHERLPSL